MFCLGCVVLKNLGLRSHVPTPQSDFIQCKADHETKEKFLTALSQLSAIPASGCLPRSELDGRYRSSKGSTKRVKDAANQFALVARGFEGSGFGYGATQL